MTKRLLLTNVLFVCLLGSFSSLSAQTFSSAERGIAVFYADYLEGQPTAYGETYRRDEMTAAHRTHPAGTMLKVTRLDTKRSVVVRVNDRGAYCDGCVIDLSKVAALQLDLLKSGKAMVSVEVMGKQNNAAAPAATARRTVPISPVDNGNGLLSTANSYSRPNAAAVERPANQHSSYPRPNAEYQTNNGYTATRSVPSTSYVSTEQPVSYNYNNSAPVQQARTPVGYEYQPQRIEAQTSYNYYQANQNTQPSSYDNTQNPQNVRSNKATYERLQARGLLPETKVPENDASFYARGNMQAPNSYEYNDEPVVNAKGNPNPSAYIQWNNTPTSTAAPQNYSSESRFPQTYQPKTLAPQGRYAVQLASYRNFDNAQRQLQALKKKGLNDAYLLETSSSGGVLYKLLNGPYGSKEDATQDLDHMKNNLLLDGIVILL
jgi:rare lipoprotein A